MGDSSEAHSEETRVSPEKNIKRTLKTPGQVIALENFYNEHKYPSEEMKTALAEQIGLTEKQISSWFCHRRLKDKRSRDEVHTNGRQDRSSGINQDRGSGLLQDSCGSTKQGDYRNIDAREVESQRLYGHDFPTADRTSRYTGNVSGMDYTSSESGSSLQDKLISQSEDPYDGETSKYPMEDGDIMPLVPKGTNSMGYKPSGYLKLKGEIENAAITAVKRQLGRHYREDGPLLGVEFEQLPPGAFACPSRDAVNGPIYIGDLSRIRCPDGSEARKQSNLSTGYEVFSTKMRSENLYMEKANRDPDCGFDSHDRNSRLQVKRKPTHDYSNPNAGGNCAMDTYENLDGETSTYSKRRPYMMNSKHHEGIRSVSVSNHHGSSGRKVPSEQKDVWLHDYENGCPEIIPRNGYMSKPSHMKLGSSKSINTEEKTPSLRGKKEERQCGEKKGPKKCLDPVRMKKHSANETKIGQRFRVEFPQQEFVAKESFLEMPRKTDLIGRSATERSSSFSEDDTAETSLSVD